MNNLTVEQKLAYLEKALKMGARFDIYFHDVENKEVAEKITNELTGVIDFKFEDKKSKDCAWLTTGFGEVQTNIFYQEYMEEDVQLDGMESA